MIYTIIAIVMIATGFILSRRERVKARQARQERLKQRCRRAVRSNR